MPAHLIATAIRSFLRIAAAWGLTPDQIRNLLGGADLESPEGDALDRILFLIGIYKLLNDHFGADLASRWATQPNNGLMFGRSTPLEYMTRNGHRGICDVYRTLRSLSEPSKLG